MTDASRAALGKRPDCLCSGAAGDLTRPAHHESTAPCGAGSEHTPEAISACWTMPPDAHVGIRWRRTRPAGQALRMRHRVGGGVLVTNLGSPLGSDFCLRMEA